MSILIPLTPVAKPRMTRQDKWLDPPRPCVAKYRAFEDRMQLIASAGHFELPHEGASFTFRVPMPASWSKKRRAQFDGKPCLSRPDLDNYLKAVFDTLLPEDSMIWHIAGMEKRWAENGSIEITVTPLTPE